MKINFKHIEYGDNQREIVDKINLNFDQILYSGIGYIGDIGQVGQIGVTGPIGTNGSLGITGENASTWYKQDNSPIGENVKKHDHWINTSPGPTGSEYIYSYDGNSWIYTGETLTKSSIFTQYQQILGPGNITNRNAILSSNFTDPWNETFVFGDYPFTLENINPNYSKVRIAMDGESELPLFTLSKLNYTDPIPPSIYWKNGDPDDHGLKFNLSGSLRLESGDDLGIYAGARSASALSPADVDGRMYIKTGGQMNVNTAGSVYFNTSALPGTSTTATMFFNTGLIANASNLTIDSALSTFDRGLEVNSFNTLTDSFDPRINLTSKIPGTSVLETNSYSFDGLDNSTEHVELEGFRNSDHNEGEGMFRTEMVILDPTGASDNVGYVKYGFPGVTGSYPISGNTEVNTSYYTSNIGGTSYSVVNLSSGTSYYENRGISIRTTNISPPVGPTPNTIWIKVAYADSASLEGIFDSDIAATYRFYHRGNGVSLEGLSHTHRFGGIIYRRPQAAGDFIVNFATPVYTFELVYIGAKRKAFYKTADDSGIIDMSPHVAGQETPDIVAEDF